MTGNRRQAPVAALILANLVLDSTLWSGAQSRGWLEYALFVAIGVPLSQILLVVAWLSWAEGRAFVRTGVAGLLAAGGVFAMVLSGTISWDPWAWLGLFVLLLFVLFVHVAVFLPLRRLRGWRLKLGSTAIPGERSRFRIGDLLLWMAVIAVPLAFFRLLATVMGISSLNRGQWAVVTMVLLMPPLLWLILLTSFAPRGSSRWALLVAGILYAACASAIGTSLFYPLLMDLPGPPGWIVLLQCIALTVSYFTLVPFVLWLNCLALRRLGWQLARPAWGTPSV